uniref:Pleiotrophin/Midkine C-terminal domain-containing protein n=1 Tax=Anopheles farauti TaxID=69004 RepID=A0A182QRE6_9DIPT
MNLLVISFLAAVSLVTFPTQTYCTPAAEAALPVNNNALQEIWTEDEREVLIRNERGTKNGGSTAAGKKNHKKEKLSPYSTQHQLHQQQQQQEPTQSVVGRKGQKKVKPTDATRAEPAANSQCRYTKGPWTECDAKSNTRSRTLSLKKGESSCVQTRTIQKKCKKACRYDKGAWSDCDNNGQMSRTDSLKQTSDATCQSTRVVNKNCNQGKSKDKQNKPPKAEKKEKGVRKNRQ